MSVANQNATLYAGDDAVLAYNLTDETGAPLNLTGATFTYTISAYDGGSAVVTKTTAAGGINVTNATGGLLSVNLSHIDTANLSGSLWQQLVMTDGSGDVSTLSTGYITFLLRTGSGTPVPAPTPPTGAVFEYQSWAFSFPELAPWVPPGKAAQYWDEATMLISNGARSPITDIPTRTKLLNLAVAHLAKLRSPIGGQEPSGLVGRISSATQGSVSVSTSYMSPASAEFWNQTPYGAMLWVALAPYRTFRYIPHPTRVVQPWMPYGYFRGF